MAATVPRTGTSWLLTVRNVVIRNVPRSGDDAAPPTVTYALVHNGAAYQSGTMTWEPADVGVDEAWAVEFLLPATPGILRATVTATLGVLTGSDSLSIKVVS